MRTVRVAIIAESFLPHMNGVTHSLLRVIDYLSERGDDILVVCPASRIANPQPMKTADVVQVPAFSLPTYRRVRIAAGGVPRIRKLLAGFAPDIVHLASPFVLGWRGVRACNDLGIPSVAVYQTEIPAYAARYGMPGVEDVLWNHVRAIHNGASLTLAPSRYACEQLTTHGVSNVRLWARGVDAARFSPAHRNSAWRTRISSEGATIIGYVGRLAVEKQVEDMARLATIPGTQLVIIGEGPQRSKLEALLPTAHFTGFLGGDALAQAVASFDVMVAPGEMETFCQAIQEAMASGVPVVAPARGGPLDLVDHSRTGWLYSPGNLREMHMRVTDLVGDTSKRRAFGASARAAVAARSWYTVCGQLVNHYNDAIRTHQMSHSLP